MVAQPSKPVTVLPEMSTPFYDSSLAPKSLQAPKSSHLPNTPLYDFCPPPETSQDFPLYDFTQPVPIARPSKYNVNIKQLRPNHPPLQRPGAAGGRRELETREAGASALRPPPSEPDTEGLAALRRQLGPNTQDLAALRQQLGRPGATQARLRPRSGKADDPDVDFDFLFQCDT